MTARTLAVLPKFFLYAEISADSIAEYNTSLLILRSFAIASNALKNSTESIPPFAIWVSS